MNNFQDIEMLHKFIATVKDPAQKSQLKKALVTLTAAAQPKSRKTEAAHQAMLRLVEEAGEEGLDQRVLYYKYRWGDYRLNIEMRRLLQEESDRDKFVWLTLDGIDREYTIDGMDETFTYQHIKIAGRGDEVPAGWTGKVPSVEKNASTDHWKMVSVEAADLAKKVEAQTAAQARKDEKVAAEAKKAADEAVKPARESMSLAELAAATRK